MKRFRNYLPGLMAALVGFGILGAPSNARAEFDLRVSTNGGSTYTNYHSNDFGATWIRNSDNVNIGGDVPADSLSIKATATVSLDTGFSSLDLDVHGTQAAKSYNLVVQTSITGVPTTPPPQLLSWMYTSSSSLGSLIEHAEGWISKTNLPYNKTNLAADTGTLTAPAAGEVSFSAVPPYSWTEQYTLTGSGRAGRSISADDNQEIVPAPAPAGLILALTGMPVLGLQAWRRRRQSRATA